MKQCPDPCPLCRDGYEQIKCEGQIYHEALGITWLCAESPYVFKEKPVAKSSTNVLSASVCQICGHPLDGKKNASRDKTGKACQCFCHKGA